MDLFLTYVRYYASTNYTTSWINTLQKACSRWKVCGKPCSADTLHKKECKSVSRVFREVPLSWLNNITV
ncbi:hypothetical protein DPMN_190007 [Dreissena polymorpha]|uniref:Uncharacterized protein n=1 Tax=Dreissena polymorpha TaxID=45954 RepID=A0A9D4DTU1_DREPO|nr:hypothetical protein DPMN_190007 [Dreissena polymorpha]